jgi:myo-inositol catabolism protein IolS
MQYRPLGKTGLEVSEVGFGSWAVSNRGYGPTDDSESILTINRALDSGINFIDTADSYGNGHSEKLIGKVLNERNDRDTIVCTKFGWDFYNKSGIRSNLNKEYIFYAVEQSLKRLQREKIDLYLIHSQNPKHIIDFDVQYTLQMLKKDGKIRNYGLSISHYYTTKYLSLINDLDWDAIELKFNLLDRNAKHLFFDVCTQKRIGLVVREPLANGMLTGKYNKASVFGKYDHRSGWTQKFLEYQIDMVDMLKNQLNLNSTDMIKTSIKYILSHIAVSSVIPGAKNVDQVAENISAIDYKLDERLISYLEQN